MIKKFFLLLIFLLIIQSVSASIDTEMLDQFNIDQEQYDEIYNKVKEFVGEDKNIVIVMGNDLSKTERLILEYVKKEYPEIYDYNVITEEEAENYDMEGRTLVLIGGPYQNSFSKQALETHTIESFEIPMGKLEFSVSADGTKSIIASDNKGYNNLPRSSAERSPLAKIIPVEYVPAAASGIGIFLIWFWKFLVPLFSKALRMGISSKIIEKVKKKELKKDYKGRKVKGIRLKYREWTSIFISSAVFALAISYTYFSEGFALLNLILINITVNFIIFSIRGLIRLVMDKVHNLHTEYVYWIWGSLIVVVTGWLGNTFALAGYTISDKEKKTDKEVNITYLIEVYTFIVALILLVWNFFMPSIIVQMASNLAVSIAYIQALPIKPFGGYSVFKWSKTKWTLLFIPMTFVYIITQIWI